MSDFIETKAGEALAARDAGDTQGIAHALIEAIAENDGTFAQTITALTAAVRRQTGQ
ncbi:predicted protein [Streptomyces viridosporus ATCC 14672]|uniref:Predicted protein n=1 Tax=Streptomyces viridosporus (strain ATCC 14672 / DSM 40746 / JCM 4963 / KCTC 9882 / NRRL B-12104 / FH 1290) TaxID=566461 RepID=D6AAU4_STRV1|nr:hypothetical protein [Streptomyces viridosporus]EFE72629.1 predicted protein [Streptomyces viridosporus ATCC 14672]